MLAIYFIKNIFDDVVGSKRPETKFGRFGCTVGPQKMRNAFAGRYILGERVA